MNLKALFNLNYFVENIKKSKGILAFLLGIVPLLNILVLIICLLEKETLLKFSTLSTITHIGMYIIPISLAVALFGFVFRQKSVDFVMSKPISRKSIYFTNLMGGIVVLILFMLINTFIFGVFSLLFESIIIPFKLLIDYFIFYLISYLFMYAISSLTISLTGNFITSIVVLLIIICIYPFLCLAIGGLTNSYSINYIHCLEDVCKPTKYECFTTECKEQLKQNNYEYYMDKEIGSNFTTPVRFFNTLEDIYSTKVLIKMFILTIIYSAIGYIAFKNRKMEDNETDFRNEFKHYLVKSVTFIPVCLITYLLMSELDLVGLLVGITLGFIYYIVYDLIIRKEIYRLSKTILIFVITFGIFNGTYALLSKIEPNKVLNVNDIKSIELDTAGFEYTITDITLIKKIFTSAYSNEHKTYSYYNVKVKTKNGNYLANLSLTNSMGFELEKYLLKEKNNKIHNYNYQNIDAINYNGIYVPVTKELKKILSNNLNEYNDNDDFDLVIYKYHNHNYEMMLLPLSLSEELYKYIINYTNEYIVEALKKDKYASNYYLSEIVPNENIRYFNELDLYVSEYVIKNNLDSFLNYLENDNKITYTNNYINIYCFDYNNHYYLRISDVEKFKKEFDMYKEKVKNNEEYQNLVKEYEESKVEVTYEY